MSTAKFITAGSVGALMPTAIQGQAAMLGELQAKMMGALKAQLGLTIHPPSLSGTIDVATKVAVNAGLALSGPSIALNFSAVAALLAEIQAALSVLLAVKVLFGTPGAGIALVALEGNTAQFGSDLQALINSGGVPVFKEGAQGFGVCLMCGADPFTVSILKTLFGL